MTAFDLFRKLSSTLADGGIEDAEADARLLAEFVCGIKRERWFIDRSKTVSNEALEKAEKLAEKRISGIPVQYLLEKWSFCGREFSVGEGVLIPRPETEELAAATLSRMNGLRNPVVFDLCAGTGCIGLSIGAERPDSSVYLFEKSPEAMNYLKANVKELKSEANVIGCDIFNGCPGGLPRPDVIVSNPPYIPSDELQLLQREVQKEPFAALDGGKDGLDFYRCIAENWIPLLNAGGFAAVECGESQAEEIAGIFGGKCETVKDFYGVSRFVIKNGKEK